jgi:hypothetical protein
MAWLCRDKYRKVSTNALQSADIRTGGIVQRLCRDSYRRVSTVVLK